METVAEQRPDARPEPRPDARPERPESRPDARPAPAAPDAPIFRARGLSLKVRLVLLVLASVVPPVVLLTALYLWSARSLVEKDLVARGELAARSIERLLAHADARVEPGLLRGEVERLVATGSGVREVSVFLRRRGAPGEDAAGALEPFPPAPVEVPAEVHEAAAGNRTVVREGWRPRPDAEGGGAERILDLAVPLDGADGAVIGAARVEVSLAEPDRLVSELRNWFLAVAGVALLVTAGWLALYLNRQIGDRTSALVASIDRARRGDLAVQAPVERLDEFGWIAENFNRLLKRVREVDATLQAKVEAATAELARKNAELVRANERLFETERSVARLERLASLGQLASTIAHEVGTPLNAIYGHIQLMRQDRALLERHAERLGVIESQIERLTTTIQGVLGDLRAPEAKPGRLDLNATLRELAAFTGAAIAARKVALETALAPDLPPVLADRAQLSHVFLNLLTNALDAMPAGGRLRIETRRDKLPGGAAAVAVEFSDTGVGISAGDMKRVFEPFYSTKALGQGTGLGLSICRQVVERHGGTVAVSSETGKGSRFTVLLPRAPVEGKA